MSTKMGYVLKFTVNESTQDIISLIQFLSMMMRLPQVFAAFCTEVLQAVRE